jgi:SpoVK/Ycf46/Vps4 family AAA+-type ATPase
MAEDIANRLDSLNINADEQVSVLKWNPLPDLDALNRITNDITYLHSPALELCSKIDMHLSTLNYKSAPNVSGFLLHGPPGVSKSRLAKSVAQYYGLPTTCIRGGETITTSLGEAESALLKTFKSACKSDPSSSSILILDDFDEIIELGGVFVSSLLVSMFKRRSAEMVVGDKHLFVIGSMK